jgi:predicted kinase
MAIMTGSLASGKSVVANIIRRAFGAEVLSSDFVRKELAGIEAEDRRYEPFGEGLYSKEMTEKTYRTMVERAGNLLSWNISCVLDASFSKQFYRDMAVERGTAHNASCVVVDCKVDKSVQLERLEKREAGVSVSDGRREILEEFDRSFEPVPPGMKQIIHDTSKEKAAAIPEKMLRVMDLHL